jgi:hypothetical protein
MPLLDQAAKAATKNLPKIIRPKAHAVLDYAIAASFFAAAAFFWRRNRRAAIGALACGAAETVSALCTDYPGGVSDKISFETHGSLQVAMSGAMASLPEILHFSDEPEATFFRVQGVAMAAVVGLTDFSGKSHRLAEELERSA